MPIGLFGGYAKYGEATSAYFLPVLMTRNRSPDTVADINFFTGSSPIKVATKSFMFGGCVGKRIFLTDKGRVMIDIGE